MDIKLNMDLANLLLSDVDGADKLVVIKKNFGDLIELEVSDIEEMMLLINDEIIYRGMNKQDTINNLGKRLYELYDEILYQKHNI